MSTRAATAVTDEPVHALYPAPIGGKPVITALSLRMQKTAASDKKAFVSEEVPSAPALHAVKETLKAIHRWAACCFQCVALAAVRLTADFLPKRWAVGLANAIGKIEGACPTFGRSLRRPFRALFGLSETDVVKVVNDHLARPYLDHVAMRRVTRGYDKLDDLQFEERNVELVQDLRNSGSSYIVATGHFTRGAMLRLFSKEVLPEPVFSVVQSHRPTSMHPQSLWTWLHLGQMLKTLTYIRQDLRLVYPGRSRAWKLLTQSLRAEGSAVVIAVDAPWFGRHGLSRAFSGKPVQRFSTGTARLSRTLQCPIVVCIPYLIEDGTVIVEWAKRFDPPAIEEAELDIVTTNAMLDEIESAIAKRPAQYVKAIV